MVDKIEKFGIVNKIVIDDPELSIQAKVYIVFFVPMQIRIDFVFLQ